MGINHTRDHKHPLTPRSTYTMDQKAHEVALAVNVPPTTKLQFSFYTCSGISRKIPWLLVLSLWSCVSNLFLFSQSYRNLKQNSSHMIGWYSYTSSWGQSYYHIPILLMHFAKQSFGFWIWKEIFFQNKYIQIEGFWFSFSVFFSILFDRKWTVNIIHCCSWRTRLDSLWNSEQPL